MFKKIFKNSAQKGQQRDSDRYDERGGAHSTATPEGGFEGRPFDINVNAVWNYDHDELCEFIQKYESYTSSLASKYNELVHAHVVAKEKTELLERERKRLIQENEQQKIYIDNLKQSLNEQSLSEPSSSSLKVTTTPSEKRQIEELIKEKVKIKGIDTGLLDEVRISGERIVSQLMEVKNMMVLGESNGGMGGNPGNFDESADTSHQNVPKSTEGEQTNDEENDHTPSNLGKGDEEKITLSIKKSFKESFMQIIDDLEMTFQLIVPKFLAINDRIKQREKEIGDTLKGDFLDALRQIDEGFTERVSSEQVEQLESKANDLRHKLVKAESSISDLGAEITLKNEQLEKAKKAHEKVQMELTETQQLIEEQIEASKREIDTLTRKIQELQEKVKAAERENKALREERSKSESQTEKIIEDVKILNQVNEKSEEDRNHRILELQKAMKALEEENTNKIIEVQKGMKALREEKDHKINDLQKTIKSLEEEKGKLQKRISDMDQEKNDIENKLIQEKLKHHQTQGDLQKAKETYEQTQKDLNEEIDGRKEDLRKLEEYKKQFLETDKKAKEYKKSIKRLSQQIVDIQNKVNADNKERERQKELNKSEIEESTPGERKESSMMEPLPTTDELAEKTEIINEQYRKIQELREELEKALQETASLKKEYTAVKDKKEELEAQSKVLQEKREKGLQEIVRMTALIDEIKAKNPGIVIPQQRPIVPSHYKNPSLTELENKKPPLRPHQQTQSINLNKSNLPKQTADYIKGIKSNLNMLYKEIIMAITTEKALETERELRTSSSRLDTGGNDNHNIAESLVRIEKKTNDVMLLLHEYTESLE